MTPYEYLNFTDTTTSSTMTMPQKDVAHGIIGVSNEAGELLGLLKKMMFNERIITRDQIADELGDVAWYMARVLRGIGMSWEELFDRNVTKLETRYGKVTGDKSVYSKEKSAEQRDKAMTEAWNNPKVDKIKIDLNSDTDPLSQNAWRAGFNGA